jgi:hypothetical protein
VRWVGQQQPVVHGFIIVTVRGEQQHASLLVRVAARLEELIQVVLPDGPQLERPVLARQDRQRAGSSQRQGMPQPDLISSSLSENRKYEYFRVLATL